MTLSHSLRSTLAVFVVFLSGSALTGCGDADDQAKDKAAPIRPVKTILVKPTITKFQRTYYAVVLASQEVDLSFRVSGRIVKLPIRNSQEVKKGDIVAQLDKRPFASKVTQMQSQLKQANAQLRVLTAEIGRASCRERVLRLM